MLNRFVSQKTMQSSFHLFSQKTKPIRLPSVNAFSHTTPPVQFPQVRMFSKTTKPIQLQSDVNKIVEVNSQVQVYSCKASNKANNECYILMRELRKEDVFAEDLNKEEMIKLFFPKTSEEMALSLSNVTSAFYGIMLQTCGSVIGMDNIDKVSKDFFYSLGRTKSKITTQAIEDQYDVPKDARGVAIILISAIYNASPEYKFRVTHFDKDHCEIELTGVDRYYRITKTLGYNEKLEWPVLHRFMEGISDEIQADVDVKSEMLHVEGSGECYERFTMRKRLR